MNYIANILLIIFQYIIFASTNNDICKQSYKTIIKKANIEQVRGSYMKLTKMTKRPSYTERLLSLPIGEEHFFALNGTAYQQFQNAKHRLKKSGRATFEMNVVVGEKKLRVVRLT